VGFIVVMPQPYPFTQHGEEDASFCNGKCFAFGGRLLSGKFLYYAALQSEWHFFVEVAKSWRGDFKSSKV